MGSFSSTKESKPASPRLSGSGEQKNYIKRYLWISIPVVIIVILAVVLAVRISIRKRLQASDSADKIETVIPVKAVTVQQTDIDTFVRYSGVIHAWQRAVILSEVTGKVKSISAKPGDSLEPGSPILKIDDELHRYSVEQAEANVLQLEANYEVSKKDLVRKKALFGKKIISDFELDVAVAKEKTDRALLESAKASLKITRRELRETLITSPIQGILAERTVDIGTNVGPGTNVATVVAIHKVKIRIGVSEKEIGTLQEGQTVAITTDAYPDRQFNGVVYSVGTKADDSTLSFPVEIMIDNSRQPLLKPGMVARTSIKTNTHTGVIAVKEDFIRKDNGSTYIWIVEDGRAKKIIISTSHAIDDKVIIYRGLKPGQALVTSGQERLFEGSLVQVVEE